MNYHPAETFIITVCFIFSAGFAAIATANILFVPNYDWLWWPVLLINLFFTPRYIREKSELDLYIAKQKEKLDDGDDW